jgi:hypothetical protein
MSIAPAQAMVHSTQTAPVLWEMSADCLHHYLVCLIALTWHASSGQDETPLDSLRESKLRVSDPHVYRAAFKEVALKIL